MVDESSQGNRGTQRAFGTGRGGGHIPHELLPGTGSTGLSRPSAVAQSWWEDQEGTSRLVQSSPR